MIKNTQTSSPAGFGMPMSWSYAVSAASVRAFPTVGGVSVVTAAGTERGLTNVAPVCADTRIADVVVLEDAFPGTSAWSPPT